jgi:hypothetical protein
MEHLQTLQNALSEGNSAYEINIAAALVCHACVFSLLAYSILLQLRVMGILTLISKGLRTMHAYGVVHTNRSL